MNTEIIEVEKMNLQPTMLFQPSGLDGLLSQIEADARALVPDVSTAKGRRAIASNAARIPRSKSYLDGLGKKLTADLKVQTKAVDVERKKMRDRLDKLKADVRAPLTKWEEEERNRIALAQDRIQHIRNLSHWENEPPNTADQLKNMLAKLKDVSIDKTFGEFIAAAAEAKDAGIRAIENEIPRREAYEAGQAELTRLREEEIKRERLAREEAIRVEAAKAAAREAEKRERESLAREEAIRAEAAKAAAREAEKRERESLAREEAIRAEAAKAAAREAEKRERESLAREEAIRAEAAKAAAREAEKRERESLAREEAIRVEAAKAAAREAEKRERKRIADQQQEEADAARRRAADDMHRGLIDGEVVKAMYALGIDKSIAQKVVEAVRSGQIPYMSIRY